MDNWSAIRHSFNLDFSYVHLALGMLAPHPIQVHEAIEKHREGLNNNPALYYRNKEAMELHVLNRAANYLHTQPTQIAITESTTMGLALVYTGIQLQPYEEILTTTHEHYAAMETLRFKKNRDGVVVKTISLYENPAHVTATEIIENLLNNITDKTRLLALTWVHSCTGVKLPIKRIAKEIEKINQNRSEKEKILIAVDGLHGFGVEELQIEEIGCDFFIAGCHKWLFGPRGTGIVWGSQRGWDKLIPIMTSFKWDAFWSWFNGKNPDDHCTKAWLCSPGGFTAFEHKWALGEAFDFHLAIGKKNIFERIHSLSAYCKEKMARIPHVRLYTPQSSELSSGMVCFDIEGLDPGAAVEKLLEKKIITGQTPYRSSCCRLTPSILNTFEELDLSLQAIEALA